MTLDRDLCYRALEARDARFDGRFFVAVRTTGVYCRPICPARTPRLENVEFFASAAAAQAAGFRPCLRCRPECSPDLAGARDSSRSVSRALALIAAGALDGPDADVAALASRLGMGERQLRRLFEKHLGASPLARAASDCVITLALSYAAPYDWPAMQGFLAARAIPGIEVVEGDRYRRAIEIGGSHGTIEVRPMPRRRALSVAIRFEDLRALPAIIARTKSLFDLSSDAAAISAQLAEDPVLAPLVAARPGLRVPGAWDPFELAVRAVLGQQITVTAARGLAGKLAAACGERLRVGADGNLVRVFPRPERISAAEIAGLGMPRARAAALRGLAAEASVNGNLFERCGDLEATVARLRGLPGIGEWTAQYIALRALREPDAFPAADAGLKRALAAPDGTRPSAAALLARAERWRPWRAYAAQHLWTAVRAFPAEAPADRDAVA